MANPQKIMATVAALIDHGEKTYTVRLHTSLRLPRFKPGQFLHLALDAFDPSVGYWPESRVFSIASATSANELVIAYTVKGSFTTRMEGELREGKEVWLKLPYGSFIVDELVEDGEATILVAGGTGITPYVAFLDKEAADYSSRWIKLFYGVRKSSLILFDDRISSAEEKCPRFELSLFIEEQSDNAYPLARRSRLEARAILLAYEKMGGAQIFLAGPPAMIDTFSRVFAAAGVPAGKIHIDQWE